MFMNLAEKVGLTNFLAPRKDKKDSKDAAAAAASTSSDSAAAATPAAAPTAEEKEMQELENKNRLLESQKDREIKASNEETSCFVKNQRVAYFHKASDTWMNDCYIVGVHHDDGEDKPYYTIRYKKPDSEEPIEKQTTHDRLNYAPWDPEQTWAILSKTW
jgi:hypothetical protein